MHAPVAGQTIAVLDGVAILGNGQGRSRTGHCLVPGQLWLLLPQSDTQHANTHVADATDSARADTGASWLAGPRAAHVAPAEQ